MLPATMLIVLLLSTNSYPSGDTCTSTLGKTLSQRHYLWFSSWHSRFRVKTFLETLLVWKSSLCARWQGDVTSSLCLEWCKCGMSWSQQQVRWSRRCLSHLTIQPSIMFSNKWIPQYAKHKDCCGILTWSFKIYYFFPIELRYPRNRTTL